MWLKHEHALIGAFLAFAVLLSYGCRNKEADGQQSAAMDNETAAPAEATQTASAIARLNPTQDNNTVRGTVTFTPAEGGVRVTADVEGLSPGPHGFHIHEKGDCSAPDASSAGGHFNPTNMPHGAPDSPQRHAGDLGNLVADESGRAHAEVSDPYLSLDGPDSIIGRAVIVHEQVDDLTSQPSGNAGGRFACGVIERG